MAARSVHRLLLHSSKEQLLVLEPWGMVIDVAVGDEIAVEVIAADPPDFDDEAFTVYAGAGAEIRVLRSGRELYSTLGNPVPSLPRGMSVRSFLKLVGLDKLRSD